MQSKRKIYIMLSRFPDNGSKAIEAMTGFYYTHASIGLEEDMNTFYSFVVKGFIVEKITRYVRADRAPLPCQLYEMEVPEWVYRRMKRVLETYVQNSVALRYSKLGVALCLFGIPYKRRFSYFCSQFVADVLAESHAVDLKKSSALYLPGDIRNLPGMRLQYQGNMRGMMRRYGIGATT